MPICPICDDSGLRNSDSVHPEFCYCAAGKSARRRWEIARTGEMQEQNRKKGQSFIDIAELEQVNASVDAMRASLLGATTTDVPGGPARHPALQLLQRVSHVGHQVTASEATQLHELAEALEGFLEALAPIGRNRK